MIAVVFATAMIIWRLPLLRSTTRLESLVSREAVFLYNNLLLVALCLTILWGVAWPILSEAVRGTSVVVGRPYYDFFLRIFGLPLLLLMGVGPLVAWRRSSLRGLGKTFAWPLGLALATGVVLLVLGAGSSIPGLIAYTFAAFVLSAIGLEFVRGTRARRALASESWPVAFASLDRAQPPPLRRLRGPCGGRAAGDRDRRVECVRLRRRGQARCRASRSRSRATTVTFQRLTERETRTRRRCARICRLA